ncbi:TPA: DUF6285 domain-containing protein [Pseudomonas aeruginosa]|jgi:hypothetical protein|uniref:DUF6285 domain-containing protein n=1 Tax=Pseudomonas peradeniyensis TaxID=2745488 RepID=A0A923G893_9PSED|nr:MULTISPECIES: DUF6285 domain-containing protein [Pseudomonas]AMK31157.1 Putative acyl-CoA dehydrogenase [Pseudomonas putida]MBC3451910.1 hypothetical protein [Pseudomonas mosselii]MBH3606444.1 hypothetical protein [Pseudomonas aeruginosa]MBI8921754.1 hypothetical protein [Pseudomonas aeruginosa]MBV4504599.1 hypothetical protein [Pseudomonas peradeniyensis]
MTQPHAHELLEIARQTLLEQVLPALPGELRYPTLMIANAMAIAARENRLDAVVGLQEQAHLAALNDTTAPSLQQARSQLARAIRQGRHDAPHSAHVLVETLRHVTLDRLAISNPKAVR